MRTIMAVAVQAYSLLAAIILFRWLENHTHFLFAYAVIPFELLVSFEIWSSLRRIRRRNAA